MEKLIKILLKGAKILVFLFILLIITILIITIKIQIEIENCIFNSNKQNGRHLNKNYKTIIKIYILKSIPIGKITITKNKLEKWKVKEKLDKNIKQIEKKIITDNNKIDKTLIESIKELKIKIQKIKLEINIGTEDAFLTSILVPIISTVIMIFLSRKMKNFEKQKIIVNPIFYNQNRINISFSGIFEIKMLHIINMIVIIIKKGRVKKYERASNRRSYDYSYE